MTRETKQMLWSSAFFPIVFLLGPGSAMILSNRAGLPKWDSTIADLVGGTLLLGAAALYAYCRVLFARVGRGTTGPIEQTKRLVAVGPYRHTRNPIYLAYVTYFLGILLVFGHALLLVIVILSFALIQTVLLLWEEPDLEERFGAEYVEYRRRTPRWLPRFRSA